MPSLPIPLISSLVLGFLLLRMGLVERRHGPLVVLLALCAVQGLVISLVQHYGFVGMRFVQPIMATLIPPMAWIAFQGTAVRRMQPRDAAHLAGPLAAVLALVVHPFALDTLIPALFVGYGLAILWTSLKGADALPRLRLEAGDLPGRIWTIMGAALIGSAFSDVLILAAQLAGAAHWQPWIISFYSSAMLLVIGALSLSGALTNAPEEDTTLPPEITEQDTQIVARLEAMMTSEKLFLDPDLTLTRLSRRMVVPVKQLSAAINKVTGENVSRFINAARIRAAQEALSGGESVTNAIYASGFNTKSNFNREFLRVTGQSPSDWLEARKRAAG